MLRIGKIFNTHRSAYKFHKNSKRDYAWFIGLQDGEVSVPEFIKAIDQQCKGKGFDAFPEAFKFWINCSFRTIDVDGELYWYINVKTPFSTTILHFIIPFYPINEQIFPSI